MAATGQPVVLSRSAPCEDWEASISLACGNGNPFYVPTAVLTYDVASDCRGYRVLRSSGLDFGDAFLFDRDSGQVIGAVTHGNNGPYCYGNLPIDPWGCDFTPLPCGDAQAADGASPDAGSPEGD